MQFQYTPFVIPLLIAAGISAWMAVTALARRSAASIALAALALALTIWSLGYGLEISGTDLATKIFWGKFQYFGITLVPLAWLVFAYNHTHPGKTMAYWTILLLSAVPLLTIGLVLTTQTNGLVWRETHLSQAGSFTVLGVSYGPWFWVHSLYSYLLNLIGAVLIFRYLGTRRGLYRGQTILLIIAVLVPWLGNILYITGASPIPHLDLTPFAFTVSVAAITWAVYGFRLIGLAPMARDLLVEEMADGMFVVDNHNQVSDVNAAALLQLERSAQEVVGHSVDEVLGHWPLLLARIHAGGELWEEMSFGDGQGERLYEIRLSPLTGRGGQRLGQVVILRDVTVRRRTDQQVRQLSRAVEASPASIMITDAQASILYVNPKFCEVTGYSREEALGKNPRLLKTEQTSPEVHRALWDTITIGKEWRGEFCNRKKNGEIYWEAASISPITDAAGKIISFVAVKEDITARKNSEQEMAHIREQARIADRMKSQLLMKVSTGLRPPLRDILTFARDLQNPALGMLTQEQKRGLMQIVERAESASTLVEEFHDEAQLDAKVVKLRHDPLSPQALLQKAEADLSRLARTRGLIFGVSVAAQVPASVYGDESRLRQVLVNLATHAILSTEKGEVLIQASGVDAEHWAIQVTDTGPGFSKNELEVLFEPFRQFKQASPYAESTGTGLGLTIARQLVDLMGGSLTVNSTPGQGSTYMLILPTDPKRPG